MTFKVFLYSYNVMKNGRKQPNQRAEKKNNSHVRSALFTDSNSLLSLSFPRYNIAGDSRESKKERGADAA